MSERKCKILSPHGKNNYVFVIKGIFKRSKLVDLLPKEMAKLKRFKAENKGRYVDEDFFK
ncbi:MAG: hypothetical protein ACFFAN_17450 [Promethearchaeota archaeon]